MLVTARKMIIRNARRWRAEETTFLPLALASSRAGWLAYAFRALIILLGWGGATYLYSGIAGDMTGRMVLQKAVLAYLPAIPAIMAILWGWAGYNWLRFHGRSDKRHNALHALSLEAMCADHDVPVDMARRMQASAIMICHLDQAGHLEKVETLPPAPLVPPQRG